MNRQKIYVAGIEVFLPDPEGFFTKVARQCEALNFEMLSPYNPQLKTAREVYDYNMGLLMQCDGLVANFNAFRGSEPDSGTVFEAGFVSGLGKTVVGYYSDDRPVRAKALEHFALPEHSELPVLLDNLRVENWGYPLNLMLYKGCDIIHAGLPGALRRMRELMDAR